MTQEPILDYNTARREIDYELETVTMVQVRAGLVPDKEVARLAFQVGFLSSRVACLKVSASIAQDRKASLDRPRKFAPLNADDDHLESEKA